MDPIERTVEALTSTIVEIETVRQEHGVKESSLLNLAVADGKRAVVSRYISRDLDKANSLYVHSGSRYLCEGGVCQMVPTSEGNHAVIVASEPLSNDPGWQRVALNHLAVVHEDLQVEQRPIEG